MENFERLNEISGLIPAKITGKFKKKYRRDTISRPEIVNGLEEIIIYRPNEGESKLDSGGVFDTIPRDIAI